jgi:hypothetical protein
MDASIPVIILAISFIVLLIWQIKISHTQSGLLSQQYGVFQNAITRQEPQVNQAHQVETNLAKLAQDLIDTAKTDDTAKAIAAKYIQHNSAAPAASPAAQ